MLQEVENTAVGKMQLVVSLGRISEAGVCVLFVRCTGAS
jgi:hypothetical protein